jgi:hypothetical protein
MYSVYVVFDAEADLDAEVVARTSHRQVAEGIADDLNEDGQVFLAWAERD